MSLESPAVILYDVSGNEIGVAANPLRIDPTGTTTQPISATSLPLPAGAATEVTLSSINTKTPSLGQALMAASQPVVIASDQSAVPVTTAKASTSAVTSTARSIANVTLKAANANRLGLTIFNDTNGILYVKLGATASTASFTVRLAANAYYEVPFGYTGIVDGIWGSAGAGNALVTELTA